MWFRRKAGALQATISSALLHSIGHRKKYKAISSTELFLKPFLQQLDTKTSSLDLGCGSTPRNPFRASSLYGIDIRDDLSNHIYRADLASNVIPFEANTFEYCTAFDFIEHIPRYQLNNGQSRFPFVELMNEIHRVLKPGGIFFHRTPAYPSKEVFSDPTHVNIITEETMPSYFCEPYNSASDYGYGFSGSFHLLDQRWLSNVWLLGIMKAIK